MGGDLQQQENVNAREPVNSSVLPSGQQSSERVDNEPLKKQERQEKRQQKLEQRLETDARKHTAFADWMEMVTEALEITVAIIVLLGFVMSVIPLLRDMPGLLNNENDYSFHVFLEHAFNLVIGIEFIRMLIKHTPGSTLGVLLFAIARHMVLDGSSGLELLMGVASIAGIFAIRKYLYVHSFESSKDESTFSWFRDQDRGKGHKENKDGKDRK